MIKKLIFCLVLLFPVLALANGPEPNILIAMVSPANPATPSVKPSASHTDYTQDANCMGAWYMNSAGDATEVDRSGESGDLTESAGDTIAQSATVPTTPVYSGYSKDFVIAETEYLTHADTNSTDINGADQKLSIVAWVKLTAVTNTQNYVIVSKFDWGTGDRQYRLNINGTAANEFRFEGYLSSDGGAGTQIFSTTTDYAITTWYHVALVYNDTDMRLYINGVLASTPEAHITGIDNGDAAFIIGAGLNSGTPEQYFNALIDEVAIFNRDLSATEVLENYNHGISGNKGGSD